MAFLNPPDVLPEAMRFLMRALVASGGSLAEDELLRLVAPEGLVEALRDVVPTDDTESAAKRKTGGRIIAKASLDAMRGAGLVVQERRGEPTLAPPVQARFSSFKEVTPAAFADLVRRTALASAAADFDDEATGGGADDLVHALALLLAMPDPLDGVRSFESGAGKTLFDFQTEHFGPDNRSWFVRNQERYRPLVRWATYLGVGRVLGGNLVVDPSIAIETTALPLVGTEVSIAEFLEVLAPVMPYTDRGVVGSSVRRRLGTPDAEVSPGLALGLLTLHHQGHLALSNKSDAESMGFRVDPDHAVQFSHVAPGGSA